jgi:hypothetical protein
MSEPKDKLKEPLTRGFLPPSALQDRDYDTGYKAGQKDAAPAVLLLSMIFGLSGFVMGAGVTGALVAIL